MFTGIVTEVGTVKKAESFQGGREFHIECSFAGQTRVDESISVNGACMTVTGQNDKTFSFQSVEETLRKTTFGDLREGDPVNLERSLRADQAIEGHFVQGHVDTVGTIENITADGADRLITVGYPAEYEPYVVGRGSIAVDGVSMTIAKDSPEKFTIAIIPYTWENTIFESRKVGGRVNLEFDIFGKYVVKYMSKLKADS